MSPSGSARDAVAIVLGTAPWLVLAGFILVFIPGIVSILATRRNQRLGDLAAATVVVRDRPVPAATTAAPRTTPPPWAPDWDVSGVTLEDLATVREFLQRRHSLEPPARARLAVQLANGLWPRVGGASSEMDPERFLEHVAAAKLARGQA